MIGWVNVTWRTGRNSSLTAHCTASSSLIASPASPPPAAHGPGSRDLSEPAPEQPGRSPLRGFRKYWQAARSRTLSALAERFRELEVNVLRWRERFSALWRTPISFRVLTARYLELIWSDRRGLRLLLCSTDRALFLLLGFVGKDFRRPMPLLRELTDEERRTLLVLRGLNDTLEGDKPITADQKKALGKSRCKFPVYPCASMATAWCAFFAASPAAT